MMLSLPDIKSPHSIQYHQKHLVRSTYPSLPRSFKHYIVYTDGSDDACGAQLSQEYDGQENPVAFLSHTFTDTQWKWSTTEQEAYGIYYAVTKWN